MSEVRQCESSSCHCSWVLAAIIINEQDFLRPNGPEPSWPYSNQIVSQKKNKKKLSHTNWRVPGPSPFSTSMNCHKTYTALTGKVKNSAISLSMLKIRAMHRNVLLTGKRRSIISDWHKAANTIFWTWIWETEGKTLFSWDQLPRSKKQLEKDCSFAFPLSLFLLSPLNFQSCQQITIILFTFVSWGTRFSLTCKWRDFLWRNHPEGGI